MMNTSDKDYRSAIERELRERVLQARPSEASAPLSSPAAPRAATPATAPLDGLALACLKCRGTSAADARFCTMCGEPFNAIVVALGSRAARS
jgi:hypothetical protein